ncbi:unnamed protein product [Moneuplotes crassus]|uniref:Uncharacterized protein n=1 Tax=Euplotes crassus TaxID=5936 RepID=A0AAD1U9K3_EUPCR|nr:unnamed protein product [Moneuplotes crassus]
MLKKIIEVDSSSKARNQANLNDISKNYRSTTQPKTLDLSLKLPKPSFPGPKMNYHPCEFQTYTSLSKMGSKPIDFGLISSMLDDHQKKKGRKHKRSISGLHSEISKKGSKNKKKLAKKDSIEEPQLTEKQKKFKFYYKPYKCEEEEQDTHMRFGDPISNKSIPKRQPKPEQDSLADEFNWDPISTLILRTRYKKFSKILTRINQNYLENSRKLIKMYPKEKNRIIVNKERIVDGDKNLSQVYMNTKETIETCIKKMIFGRILKSQNKIENSYKKNSPQGLEITERAISMVKKHNENNTSFNEIKISRFPTQRRERKKPKMLIHKRLKTRTRSKFKSSKNKLKKILEKSDFKTDDSLNSVSSNSADSEQIMTAFENYWRSQRHKFVPRTTIRALRARERSIPLAEKHFETPIDSRKSRSTDFSFKTKNPHIKKANLKSRVSQTRRSPENPYKKLKTPYIAQSVLEMPSINLNHISQKPITTEKTQKPTMKSPKKSKNPSNPPKNTQKLSNIYSFNICPISSSNNTQNKRAKSKLFHIPISH